MMKRVVGFLLSVGAFVCGLLLTSWFLGRTFPNFDEFAIRQKLVHLEKHLDEYDTLFLGSSRVYHQISPALFDKIAGEAGVPTRSFNFGVDALFPPEDSYIAEYIAALRPKNLRWVFVEVSMFLPDWAEKNSDSPRAVYWHDWTRTSMAVRDILDNTKSFEWKKRKKHWKSWEAGLQGAGAHIQMFVRNTTNLGRGGAMLLGLLKEQKTKPGQNLGRNGDGYAPLMTRKEADQAELKDYEKLITSRRTNPIQYRPLSRVGQENLDRVLAAVRKTGATPVLVLSPVLTRNFLVPRRKMEELYLDFADVHTWPELYRKEHLYDVGHLSKPGAELYTRYIAESWLAVHGPGKSKADGAIIPTTSGLDAAAVTP